MWSSGRLLEDTLEQISVRTFFSIRRALTEAPELSWLNPLLEGGLVQEGRVSRLLAGLRFF